MRKLMQGSQVCNVALLSTSPPNPTPETPGISDSETKEPKSTSKHKVQQNLYETTLNDRQKNNCDH